jgi:hypothetical protein
MSPKSVFQFLLLLSAIPLFVVAQVRPAVSSAVATSIPTADRLRQPAWWPTKMDAPRADYAGTTACARCHSAIAVSYRDMAMSHASEPATDSTVLRHQPDLHFQLGPYRYTLSSAAGKTVYAVTDGKQSLSFDLQWAMGAGSLGQTYVIQDADKFYESELSFYSATGGLDITTGHSRDVPGTLEAAAGRRMLGPAATRCFACHTTASSDANKFDPARATNGVTCEACHGPGYSHVAAERAGMQEANGLAFNPGTLDRASSVDFCGACHRTTADVIENGWVDIGVMNARFQPYRLQKSACWERGDARLTCTSCHDPHKPLQHDAASYDASCLRCHVVSGETSTADRPGKGCKVDRKNCVTCHMPKYELPGAHSEFSDHYIRVVKAGEPYPN